MNKKHTFIGFILLLFIILLLAVLFLHRSDVVVIHPKGMIGQKQSNLLVASTLLMLIVVIPVFFLSFIFAWKYRVDNSKAKYTPEWDRSRVAEFIWWAIPCGIIFVLSVMTYKSSHALDPFKPLESSKKPITIQVIALQWKWLFIYPEEKIAVVNFFQFPEKTPVNFEITADAPMNSFWIPQLGGQVYAMPGMKSKLHLIANEAGSFRGSSANLSGEGFAGMVFFAKSSSQEDFDQWVESIKQSPLLLSSEEYDQVAQPSKNNPVATFALAEESLFDQILMKYMMPMKQEMK